MDELCKKGNPAAVIFYLKTKGKDRGYIEKSDTKIDINLTKMDIKFEVPTELKTITDIDYLPENLLVKKDRVHNGNKDKTDI